MVMAITCRIGRSGTSLTTWLRWRGSAAPVHEFVHLVSTVDPSATVPSKGELWSQFRATFGPEPSLDEKIRNK